jgi:hypothetical protein
VSLEYLPAVFKGNLFSSLEAMVTPTYNSNPITWKGFNLSRNNRGFDDEIRELQKQLSDLMIQVQSTLNNLNSKQQHVPPFFFSVLDFGADNTGTRDSTTSITNAIAAMPASGGALYFPAGTYLVSSAIALNKNGRYFGDGPGMTIISTNSATANIFNLTATNYITVDGFQFKASVTRTGGYYIDLGSGGGGWARILNFQMDSPYNGIHVNGQYALIQNGLIYTVISSGIVVSSGQPTIDYVFVDGAGMNTGTGVVINACSSAFITKCNLSFLNIGILLQGSTAPIDAVYITDTICDQPAQSGVVIWSTAAAGWIDAKVDGVFTSNAISYGLEVVTSGTGFINFVQISKCNLNSGHSLGMLLTGPGTRNIQITNNKIFSNTTSGIQIDTNVNGVVVTGNSVVSNGGYGIFYGTGVTGLVLASNDLRGNTSGEESASAPAASAGSVIRGSSFVGYNV